MMTSPPETAIAEDARREGDFQFGDRTVRLLEPLPGQQLILVTVLALGDEGGSAREKMEIISNFGTMLASLFVEEADRMFVHGALARGSADLEEYIDLARQMAEFWDVGEETANNRAERRARERRPAQAVRARGR